MTGEVKNNKYLKGVDTENGATTWYFEKVEGKEGYYYIYCL